MICRGQHCNGFIFDYPNLVELRQQHFQENDGHPNLDRIIMMLSAHGTDKLYEDEDLMLMTT